LHLAATNRYTLSGQEKAREGRIAPEARAISDLTYDNLEGVCRNRLFAKRLTSVEMLSKS